MGECHSETLALSFLTKHPASVTIGAYVGALEKDTGKKVKSLHQFQFRGWEKEKNQTKPNWNNPKQSNRKLQIYFMSTQVKISNIKFL